MEVEGLCQGGDTDVTKSSVGYIIFIKNEGEGGNDEGRVGGRKVGRGQME